MYIYIGQNQVVEQSNLYFLSICSKPSPSESHEINSLTEQSSSLSNESPQNFILLVTTSPLTRTRK